MNKTKSNQHYNVESQVASTFNRIFYKQKKLRTHTNFSLEQNIFYSYFINNLSPEQFISTGYRRAVFADYFLDKKPNSKQIVDNYLVDSAPRHEGNINRDALMAYCISNFPTQQTLTKKRKLSDTRLQRIEPDNTAIMLSVIYKNEFQNTTLLKKVRSTFDTADLKSLLFIDYVLTGRIRNYQHNLNRSPATKSIEQRIFYIINLIKPLVRKRRLSTSEEGESIAESIARETLRDRQHYLNNLSEETRIVPVASSNNSISPQQPIEEPPEYVQGTRDFSELLHIPNSANIVSDRRSTPTGIKTRYSFRLLLSTIALLNISPSSLAYTHSKESSTRPSQPITRKQYIPSLNINRDYLAPRNKKSNSKPRTKRKHFKSRLPKIIHILPDPNKSTVKIIKIKKRKLRRH